MHHWQPMIETSHSYLWLSKSPSILWGRRSISRSESIWLLWSDSCPRTIRGSSIGYGWGGTLKVGSESSVPELLHSISCSTYSSCTMPLTITTWRFRRYESTSSHTPLMESARGLMMSPLSHYSILPRTFSTSSKFPWSRAFLNLQNLIVLAPAKAWLCEARVPITSRYS